MKSIKIVSNICVLAALAQLCCNAQSLQRIQIRALTPDLAAAMNEPDRKKFLNYFELHRKEMAPTNLLPVAILYALEKRYPESSNLYSLYLEVRPNDPRANRGIGGLYLLQEDHQRAAKAFEKAWHVGDVESLAPLAFSYAALGDRERIAALVPDMLRIRRTAVGDLRSNLAQALIMYTLGDKEFNKPMFSQAIEGLTDDEIIGNEDFAKLVILGLKRAGEDKRALAMSKRLDESKEREKNK